MVINDICNRPGRRYIGCDGNLLIFYLSKCLSVLTLCIASSTELNAFQTMKRNTLSLAKPVVSRSGGVPSASSCQPRSLHAKPWNARRSARPLRAASSPTAWRPLQGMLEALTSTLKNAKRKCGHFVGTVRLTVLHTVPTSEDYLICASALQDRTTPSSNVRNRLRPLLGEALPSLRKSMALHELQKQDARRRNFRKEAHNLSAQGINTFSESAYRGEFSSRKAIT